ncbi:uncharacterized protein LOC131257956 isoform X2 [Magnolia sinica]|uniref:uncharacterized protein LOC131257956 isoform X2 n=1 Tax=Magnolia sinica TaxID=86752 RepID=UPI00265B1FA4|nr:uncharacterized protein LOC131257956 isoform X2 [Magnolia sinica]
MDSQIQILLGSDAAPFEYVINSLLSAHNESRAQAEHLLNACKLKYPGILLMKLAHILQHGSEPGSRSMAAVLLRKNIGLWLQLDNVSRGKVKQQLLSCLVSEEVRSVWKLLCDTVAELASTVIYEDGWPELLPFLFQCGGSENLCLKEKALLVLGQYMPIATSEMHPHLDTIHEFFRQSLSLSMPGQVHLAALHAVASFIQFSGSPKRRDMFQDLLMPIMQALTSALEAHFEVVAQEELEVLIEVAGIAPGFLRGQLHEVLGFMIEIVEAQGLEDGTRHLALEFFLTLAETRGFATGVMRKLPQLVARLFVFLVNLLVDVEDTPLWYAADMKDLNAGLSTNFETGKEGLDRLSYSLGGKIILPIASEVVPSYLNDLDWRKRHAALITLSQIAEGCQKVMIKSLDSVVDMVLVSFSDPHIRVRWAAISAISQLCIDFSSEPVEHFHQKIAPALNDALGDFQNARVQAHAAAAIANFCRGCTAEVLKPWLGGLTEKLLLLLQNGKLMQQEVALTALAAVAYSAQSLFRVYYDVVIPYLKHILCNTTDSEDRMLRAKSLECISVIGLAVGKDKFSHDVKEVSDVFKGLQTSVLSNNGDDPTACYMLQAWARICKCLGKDFLPYIGAVMPPLLQMVQLNPGVTVTDANALFEQVTPSDHDRNSRTTITIGNKRIGVNINMLEDKTTACNVLSCIVDELKEGFYPWLDQVLPILVPLLNFSFHEVRMAAVSAMPQLLHVGKSAVGKGLAQGRNASFVKELSDYIIASLVKALHKELLVGVLTKMLGSLDESIQISWTILEADQVQDVVDVLKHVIIASISRRREILEQRALEVFDEEEFELLKEEDAEETAVFEQVGKCFGTLAKLQKSAFAPYFNELVPFIARMLVNDWTLEEKYIAICIFNDVAENCGASAIRYHGIFLPFLLEASMDADADVCVAAIYGIGVCAEHGDAKSMPFIEEALRRLYYIIKHRSTSKFDNQMATDNAISALGKICEYRRDCINATQVLPAWLSCLPIRNDLKEAKVLHGLFFRMVARSDALLLGRNNQNLPKILSVFAEILTAEGDLAYEETLAEIPDLLRKLMRAIPPTAFASLWASLPARHQEVLHPIFKT